MKKLIVILMALIAYSTQALADKVSFTASAPDVVVVGDQFRLSYTCLLYTSPSPRDSTSSRMPSSA